MHIPFSKSNPFVFPNRNKFQITVVTSTETSSTPHWKILSKYPLHFRYETNRVTRHDSWMAPDELGLNDLHLLHVQAGLYTTEVAELKLFRQRPWYISLLLYGVNCNSIGIYCHLSLLQVTTITVPDPAVHGTLVMFFIPWRTSKKTTVSAFQLD